MTNEVKEEKVRGSVEVHEEECKGCALCIEACSVCGMHLSERLNGHGYHFGEYQGAIEAGFKFARENVAEESLWGV